ncbi:MAG: phosphotransferase [Caldilineaceae bacterium]
MTNFQQIEAILRHWQTKIGEAEQIELTHEKPEGFAVTSFFVHTARQKRFVLKNVLGNPNVKRLDSEYQLLQYLHKVGVPVAVPVLADDGRLSIENEQGIYLLYPVLPTGGGDAPDVDVRVIYENLGIALAKLHQALALYPYSIESWTMNLPQTLAEDALPQIRQALTGESLQKFEQVMVALQPEMTAALTGLPLQYIHGDCHGGNILFYAGEVSGFIDLDHLPQGPRVYDIGYFLADRAKIPFVGYQILDNWLEDFPCVLAGYEKLEKLSAQERHALWFIMLATQLMFVYWFFKYESRDAADKNLAAFYWLYERKTEILQQIASTAA